jgi:hypothetical protein
VRRGSGIGDLDGLDQVAKPTQGRVDGLLAGKPEVDQCEPVALGQPEEQRQEGLAAVPGVLPRRVGERDENPPALAAAP